MPRNNSLVGKVRRALKGLVLNARTEQDLKKNLYREVRRVVVRTGLRKDPDTVMVQADFVCETLSKDIVNLSEGGVKLSL
jgi:hypothetical protein